MVRSNLQELPRFSDKLSYLYVDRAIIEQDAKSVAIHQFDGVTSVPAASLSTLILGPGTKITHEAIKTLADNNCLVIWAGEHGVRFYAMGIGGSRHSRNIIQQAKLVSNDITRLQVVVRMYTMRFKEQVDPGLTLQQLRGKEGIRVRQAYADASNATALPWEGRSYKRDDWYGANPVNRALSAANACLYGLVHAAILAGGYSPALGFIHTGKQLSFVYDVADLYKIEHIVPLAFDIAKREPPQLEREVRTECRRMFRGTRLIERILPDIAKALDVPPVEQGVVADDYAEDPARPAELWQPQDVSADLPIGKILKLDPAAGMKFPGASHGGDDSGKGAAIVKG